LAFQTVRRNQTDHARKVAVSLFARAARIIMALSSLGLRATIWIGRTRVGIERLAAPSPPSDALAAKGQ